MNETESSIAVANYFIKRAREEGAFLNAVKLLKLVYISHGWYLSLYDVPLLHEVIFAFKYGPVVALLHKEIYFHGDENISNELSEVNSELNLTQRMVSDSKFEFLNKIWDTYKKYTSMELSTLVRAKGSPWLNTYDVNNHNNQIIPNDMIKNYYDIKMLQIKINDM